MSIVLVISAVVDVEGSRDVDADVVDVDVSVGSNVEVNAVVLAVLEATVELVEAVEVTSTVLKVGMDVVDRAMVDVD